MRDTDSIVGAFEIFEVDLKDSDSQLEEIAEKIVLIGLSEILKRYHPLDFELNQRREIPRTLKDVVCDPFRLQTREVNVVDQRYFQLRDLEHPFLWFRQEVIGLHQQLQTVFDTHNVPDPHFTLQHPLLPSRWLVEDFQEFRMV